LFNISPDLDLTRNAEESRVSGLIGDYNCASQPDVIQIPDPQPVPIASDETAGIPITDPYSLEDASGASLASLDFNLNLGTCMNPQSSDAQGLLGCTSSIEILDRGLEGLPSPIEPPVTNNLAISDKELRSPERIEDLIDELSDRVGTLRFGPEGQPHFYGPTSTFNLPDAPVTTKPQTHRTLDCRDSDLNPDEEAPLALEEHLLNLYFTWHDPSFHVVDRDIFEEARRAWQGKEKTPFYSEALCYAM
jgi:hypothetical protein